MGGQSGKEAVPTSSSPTSSSLESRGIRTMDRSIARKLTENRGGITYQLRVIIRGDRETGKSCLLKRLQGGDFNEKHEETQQIQVAHINWNYKTTNEVVLVEVWDVVDKAKQNEGGQKLLDASDVDVYQGASAVILLIDPTREWTLEYAKRELKNIASPIDILLLCNFRDSPAVQRVVSEREIQHFLRSQPENVRYLECSLKNGFGLKHFYSFLNLPFLKHKIATLNSQLKQCKVELSAAEQEIELLLEQDYSHYIQWLSVQMNKQDNKQQEQGKLNENEKQKQIDKEKEKNSAMSSEAKIKAEKEHERADKLIIINDSDSLDSFAPGGTVDGFFDEERPENSEIAQRAERTRKEREKEIKLKEENERKEIQQKKEKEKVKDKENQRSHPLVSSPSASSDELDSSFSSPRPTVRAPVKVEIEEDFDSFGVENERNSGSVSVFGGGAEMLVRREKTEKEKQKEKEKEREREREKQIQRDKESQIKQSKSVPIVHKRSNSSSRELEVEDELDSEPESPKLLRRKVYRFDGSESEPSEESEEEEKKTNQMIKSKETEKKPDKRGNQMMKQVESEVEFSDEDQQMTEELEIPVVQKIPQSKEKQANKVSKASEQQSETEDELELEDQSQNDSISNGDKQKFEPPDALAIAAAASNSNSVPNSSPALDDNAKQFLDEFLSFADGKRRPLKSEVSSVEFSFDFPPANKVNQTQNENQKSAEKEKKNKKKKDKDRDKDKDNKKKKNNEEENREKKKKKKKKEKEKDKKKSSIDRVSGSESSPSSASEDYFNAGAGENIDSFYSNFEYRKRSATNELPSSNPSSLSSAASPEPAPSRKSSFFDRFRKKQTQEEKKAESTEKEKTQVENNSKEKEKVKETKKKNKRSDEEVDYDEM
jgi:hypothetical protein